MSRSWSKEGIYSQSQDTWQRAENDHRKGLERFLRAVMWVNYGNYRGLCIDIPEGITP